MNDPHAVRNNKVLQSAAVPKRAGADYTHVVGYIDVLQRRTFAEGHVSNGGHTFRDYNTHKILAITERACAYFRNAFRNNCSLCFIPAGCSFKCGQFTIINLIHWFCSHNFSLFPFVYTVILEQEV